TIKDLIALGYPYDTFDQLQPDHPDFFDLSGKTVSCYCRHETYEDQTREKWSFILEDYVPATFERREVAAINAEFKDLWKKYRPAPAPTPVIATVAGVNGMAAEPTADSDIPF